MGRWPLCFCDADIGPVDTVVFRRRRTIKGDREFYYFFGLQPPIGVNWFSTITVGKGDKDEFLGRMRSALKEERKLLDASSGAKRPSRTSPSASDTNIHQQSNDRKRRRISVDETPRKTGASAMAPKQSIPDDSPHTQLLSTVFPLKSRDVLGAKKQNQKLTWKSVAGHKVPDSSVVRKHRGHLKEYLMSSADANPIVAAALLVDFLKQPGNQAVENIVKQCLYQTTPLLEESVLQSQQLFMKHFGCSPKGRNKLDSGKAIDGILCGSVLGDVANGNIIPIQGISEMYSVHRRRVVKCIDHVKEILRLEPGALFAFPQTKPNVDWSGPAFSAVHKWCHSGMASKCEPNVNRERNVRVPHSDKKEAHVRRVWLEIGWHNRLRSFQKSDYDKQFNEESDGGTIGITRFKQYACKCIHDPQPASCVNVITSSVAHSSEAVREAVTRNQTVRDMIQQCPCPNCTSDRNHHAEDGTVKRNWIQRMMSMTPQQLTEATMCDAVAEPSLCLTEGVGTPPQVIPWACGQCDNNDRPLCDKCGLRLL